MRIAHTNGGEWPAIGAKINALVTTAPEALRDQLRGLTTRSRVALAAKFRTGETPTSVVEATRYALRELARRYQHLTEQIDRFDTQLDRLIAETAPTWWPRSALGHTPQPPRSSPRVTTLCGSLAEARSRT